MRKNYKKNPSQAIDRMHSKITKLKTDSSLFSAMNNFGNQEFRLVKAGRKSSSIPVPISRRKYVNGARRCQQIGRPAKKSYAPEHSYSKRKKDFKNVQAKRNKNSHCLQECVDKNVSGR